MPIRVLMFGWELPPFNSGGLGVACDGLSTALAQQNIDLTFVLPHRFPINKGGFRLVFADDQPSDWSNQSPYLHPTSSPAAYIRDFLLSVRRYARNARRIAAENPHDLIHAHDWLCFPAGISAGQVSDRPLVSHIHATEYDRSGGSGADPIVYSLEKQGLDEADAVIAVSNFTKRLLTAHYFQPASKVNVVHNGIKTEEFGFESPSGADILDPLKKAGYKVVLYVGRLTMSKAPDNFIRAAARVLEYQPKTVFLLAGSGEMESQVISLAARLGISDKVLFAGFIRGTLLHQVFRTADLFIMPSVSEPFGLTALEAVASGTPALISRQSGVSEALSHVLKVDFWDIDEMVNQIVSVLSHPPLHDALQANGRKEVKGVSWAAAAAKTIEIYKKVLRKN
ncbi:MAG: 4-alpha-glucanotransferase [Candidatus Amesbacteria bacterium GW2011_GWA1_47_16]|uniref:4-alpha-glucanotransferase n=1 Tax=Candidatus Amesbacteria bacterium GW2011_GWA1_47_16 TaxID=1618353 RepID=A0A0G1UBI7_9BACT|nr:MAG: 4-alpha-glucanotransferase [Candidatus Amesbacteria bacterium GW2011_GWA1_47_16]